MGLFLWIWQDVPEEYIKDVIVELYLNNIPISNIDLSFESKELVTSLEGKLSFVDLEYNTNEQEA